MITIIKCIDSQFPNRPDIICSSIVGRTSSWYKDKLKREDVKFIEKNTIEHWEWLNENKINNFPTLLFYKDDILKITKLGIMAQAQIMEVIENL